MAGWVQRPDLFYPLLTDVCQTNDIHQEAREDHQFSVTPVGAGCYEGGIPVLPQPDQACSTVPAQWTTTPD